MSSSDKINKIMLGFFQNTITKDILENQLDFEELATFAHKIIKTFGHNYYHQLEEHLIIKKIIMDKVPIDYIINIFNYNFLVKYRDIIVKFYGQNEFDKCVEKYT